MSKHPRGDPALQLQTLQELTQRAADQLTYDQREAIFHAAAFPANPEVQLRAAVLLSQLYPVLAPIDPEFARRTHVILLRDLREPRKTLAHPSCSWLVMTHLREENLAHIPWESPEEVAGAAECFYGFCAGGLTAEESHLRVRDLVKYAGIHFVKQGRLELAFQLFTRVPVPTTLMDADLFRLRNALILYEQRRIRRVRRTLYFVLAAVALFAFLVSPLLFVWAEAPYHHEHGGDGVDFFSALYWSVMTFTTVGYGDVTPQTIAGRVLAMIDGVLGVTVLGVIAGSILGHVTPRQLP